MNVYTRVETPRLTRNMKENKSIAQVDAGMRQVREHIRHQRTCLNYMSCVALCYFFTRSKELKENEIAFHLKNKQLTN